MIQTKRRLSLCVFLLICNILFIWGNSLLPSTVSGAISGWVRDLLHWLLGQGEQKPPSGGESLLRKIAHLTEFTCLGLCLRWLVSMVRTGKWDWLWIPLATGVFVACVDETIQYFVPGRNSTIKDVGLDTLGVILGIAMISLILYLKNQKRRITK